MRYRTVEPHAHSWTHHLAAHTHPPRHHAPHPHDQKKTAVRQEVVLQNTDGQRESLAGRDEGRRVEELFSRHNLKSIISHALPTSLLCDISHFCYGIFLKLYFVVHPMD